MQITTFNPMILTSHADEVIALFEALGFERKHKVDNIDQKDITSVRMKDANGFHVDVASSNHVPRDLTSIRINVDDFDEAYDFFMAHGFVNPRGDRITATSSSVDTYLVSPSGFAVTLCHHIK